MPNRMARKGMFKDQHFDSNFAFLYSEIDRVTQKEKITVMPIINPSNELLSALIGEQVLDDTHAQKVHQFKDFLEKCLILDPKDLTQKKYVDAFPNVDSFHCQHCMKPELHTTQSGHTLLPPPLMGLVLDVTPAWTEVRMFLPDVPRRVYIKPFKVTKDGLCNHFYGMFASNCTKE
ncbi:hypothetical protein EMCRGX_G030993 [Ephydatia muelleri]